jgi:hypothetical protein
MENTEKRTADLSRRTSGGYQFFQIPSKTRPANGKTMKLMKVLQRESLKKFSGS